TKSSSYLTSESWWWTLLMELRTPTFTSRLSKPRCTLARQSLCRSSLLIMPKGWRWSTSLTSNRQMVKA
ncbi:hypothetical protein CR513_43900, partial [Mucuna pruriens]